MKCNHFFLLVLSFSYWFKLLRVALSNKHQKNESNTESGLLSIGISIKAEEFNSENTFDSSLLSVWKFFFDGDLLIIIIFWFKLYIRIFSQFLKNARRLYPRKL